LIFYIADQIQKIMTPERIKLFLRCFYKNYILECYEGYDMDADKNGDLQEKMEHYDVTGYFLKHLDIYVDNTDFMKEYALLYNPALFNAQKESNPEVFNELQIFLIENIQLFLYAILEAAINSYILKTSKVNNLRLRIKPIDNKTVELVKLIDLAEGEMKNMGISPPAMG
jgi:hypothetical protein